MSAAEPIASFRIVNATTEHDGSVRRLAEQSGLCVDASAHRAQKGALLLVCLTSEGEPIGFLSARALFSEVEIFDLCVAVGERRRGIGRALFMHLFATLRSAGVSEAFLEVRASNGAARALYQSLGFSRVDTRRGYYADGEDAVLFRCCFAPAP